MTTELGAPAIPSAAGPLPRGAGSASVREASKGSATRLGAEIVVRLSAVLATLWLTRSLGVSTFGTFMLALSIGLMIAELCDLGLNAVVVPAIVRSRGNVRTLFRMKATVTVGVFFVSTAIVPLAARFSGLDVKILALTTLHYIGASWIEMTGTTLRALGRRVEEVAVLSVFRLALLGLVIAAPFGISVLGASLAYAFAIGPAIILGGWLLASGPSSWDSAGSSIRVILRQAAPMGVNGYFAIFSTRVEVFLLQAFHGAQMVGLFGGAVRIVESLLSLPSAIAAGALPSVARDVVQGSRGAAQRTVGLVVWLGVPAAIGLALCAPDVLRVLGPGFVDAVWALRILSVALFLCFSNAALFHVLIAASQTAVIPKLTAARVLLALALGTVLVPSLGLVGASLSFTAAELFLFGALMKRSRAYAEIRVARPFLWALLACVPMTAFLLSVQLSLPLSIAVGASSFGLTTAVILRRGSEEVGLS